MSETRYATDPLSQVVRRREAKLRRRGAHMMQDAMSKDPKPIIPAGNESPYKDNSTGSGSSTIRTRKKTPLYNTKTRDQPTIHQRNR